jgi:hypothetical protein
MAAATLAVRALAHAIKVGTSIDFLDMAKVGIIRLRLH